MSHPLERSCPKCAAPARQPCQGKRGDRKSVHRERWHGQNFRPLVSTDDASAESPIELAMIRAINGWIAFYAIDGVKVLPQGKMGPYRADIMVEDRRGETRRRLAVECDGQNFHTKPAQVDRDKRRDRWCAVNGIAVMRFPGGEIQRDARGCAAQVGEWIRLGG